MRQIFLYVSNCWILGERIGPIGRSNQEISRPAATGSRFCIQIQFYYKIYFEVLTRYDKTTGTITYL